MIASTMPQITPDPNVGGAVPVSHDPTVARMLENFIESKQGKIGVLPKTFASKIDILRREPPTTSGVYIVRCANKYKIGHTTNFARRVKSFKTANPDDIVLEAFIGTENRLQAKRLETALHRVFDAKRIKGEWFLLNEGDLEFVNTYQMKVGQQGLSGVVDTEVFQQLTDRLIRTSLQNTATKLGRRYFTIQEMMGECPDIGLPFATWKCALDTLHHDKVLYCSGEAVRLPRDFSVN